MATLIGIVLASALASAGFEGVAALAPKVSPMLAGLSVKLVRQMFKPGRLMSTEEMAHAHGAIQASMEGWF